MRLGFSWAILRTYICVWVRTNIVHHETNVGSKIMFDIPEDCFPIYSLSTTVNASFQYSKEDWEMQNQIYFNIELDMLTFLGIARSGELYISLNCWLGLAIQIPCSVIDLHTASKFSSLAYLI
jgi:hypothetical protein